MFYLNAKLQTVISYLAGQQQPSNGSNLIFPLPLCDSSRRREKGNQLVNCDASTASSVMTSLYGHATHAHKDVWTVDSRGKSSGISRDTHAYEGRQTAWSSPQRSEAPWKNVNACPTPIRTKLVAMTCKLYFRFNVCGSFFVFSAFTAVRPTDVWRLTLCLTLISAKYWARPLHVTLKCELDSCPLR